MSAGEGPRVARARQELPPAAHRPVPGLLLHVVEQLFCPLRLFMLAPHVAVGGHVDRRDGMRPALQELEGSGDVILIEVAEHEGRDRRRTPCLQGPAQDVIVGAVEDDHTPVRHADDRGVALTDVEHADRDSIVHAASSDMRSSSSSSDAVPRPLPAGSTLVAGPEGTPSR